MEFFFFQAEDGIRDLTVTGVQTCALPIYLESIGRYVQVGTTPVIIADAIEWSDAASVDAERRSLNAALEQWRADWQGRDTERHPGHYSQRFGAGGGQDYAAWAAPQRAGDAAKNWIKIELSRVAM